VSGVELALWDLAGKARGVPVHQLLGGLCQPRARAYASLLRYETTAHLRQAVSSMLAVGYTAAKLHQIDVESVAAAREVAGPDVDLMLDTNCPWTVEDAIRIGRRLERYDLRWLEEPVWPPEDYAGLARVRRALRIPIACGENEATVFAFREIIAAGAADIVQPDVTVVGGVTEWLKAAALASAHGLPVAPHYFSEVHAHLVAATPGAIGVEYFYPDADIITFDPVLQDPLRPRDGRILLSERPGVGLDLIPEAVERLRVAHATIEQGGRAA